MVNSIALLCLWEQIEAIAGVQGTHHMHVWSLGEQHPILSTYMIVAEDIDRDELEEVNRRVIECLGEFQLSHITIPVEAGENYNGSTHS